MAAAPISTPTFASPGSLRFHPGEESRGFVAVAFCPPRPPALIADEQRLKTPSGGPQVPPRSPCKPIGVPLSSGRAGESKRPLWASRFSGHALLLSFFLLIFVPPCLFLLCSQPDLLSSLFDSFLKFQVTEMLPLASCFASLPPTPPVPPRIVFSGVVCPDTEPVRWV